MASSTPEAAVELTGQPPVGPAHDWLRGGLAPDSAVNHLEPECLNLLGSKWLSSAVIISEAAADERPVSCFDDSQLLQRTAELANAAVSLREGALAIQDCLAKTLGWTALGCRVFGDERAPTLLSEDLLCLEGMRALWADSRWFEREAVAAPVVLQVEDGGHLVALLGFWPGSIEATVGQLALLAKVARQLAVLAQRDVCYQGALVRELDILRQGQLAGIAEAAQSLSHELSQPLAALAAYVGALRRHLDETLSGSSEITYLGERLLQQVERAGNILQGTKSFILQRTCTTGSVDVEATVRQLSKVVRRSLRAISVELHLDIASGLPPARGNESHVAQIILSLLANAVAALQPIPAARRRVEIKVVQAEREVRISVADSGHHMMDEALEGFEPLYAAYADSAQIGLAISRSLAEIQGGRLWKEEIGGEIAFIVALPIVH